MSPGNSVENRYFRLKYVLVIRHFSVIIIWIRDDTDNPGYISFLYSCIPDLMIEFDD